MRVLRNLSTRGIALLATATAASAAIMCNEDGDCWHTTRCYACYRPVS